MAVVISVAVGTGAEVGVGSEIMSELVNETVIGVGVGIGIGIVGEGRAVSEVRTAVRAGKSLLASMTTHQALVIGLISFGFGSHVCWQAYPGSYLAVYIHSLIFQLSCM